MKMEIPRWFRPICFAKKGDLVQLCNGLSSPNRAVLDCPCSVDFHDRLGRLVIDSHKPRQRPLSPISPKSTGLLACEPGLPAASCANCKLSTN